MRSTIARPSFSGSMLVNALMSAPAENVNGFEEAMTTARALPSTDSHTSLSSPMSCGESGLAGGRLSHRMAMSPRVSTRTVSRCSPSSGCG